MESIAIEQIATGVGGVVILFFAAIMMMFMAAMVMMFFGMIMMLVGSMFMLFFELLMLPFTLIELIVVFLVSLFAPNERSVLRRLLIFAGASSLSGALVAACVYYATKDPQMTIFAGASVGVLFGIMVTITNYFSFERYSSRFSNRLKGKNRH